MGHFLLRRTVQSILTLVVISFMAFGLTFIAGDPVDAMLPQDADAAQAERLREALGLDQPMHVQYFRFLGRAVQGDFGEAIKWRGQSAMGLVMERLPATLELAGLAMLISIGLAVPIGVASAVRRDTSVDRVGKVIALLGQSLPPFWLGIMLIWILAVGTGWFPVSGRGSLAHLILPAITLGWYQVAAIMRLTRSAMLDVLDSEYIKLARMKGVLERRIVWVHALKNALIVPLTYSGLIVGVLITRTVVVESVFGWPGTGSLVLEAVIARDFPVVNALLITFALIFILAQLLVDILYAVIDPRIRR
jgi:peptide/nickel transport system permease protein